MGTKVQVEQKLNYSCHYKETLYALRESSLQPKKKKSVGFFQSFSMEDFQVVLICWLLVDASQRLLENNGETPYAYLYLSTVFRLNSPYGMMEDDKCISLL